MGLPGIDEETVKGYFRQRGLLGRYYEIKEKKDINTH